MRNVGVICDDCKYVFTIDFDKLAYYQNFGINPYTCPNCSSINCRNMTTSEVNNYNKNLDKEYRKQEVLENKRKNKISKIKKKLKELIEQDGNVEKSKELKTKEI